MQPKLIWKEFTNDAPSLPLFSELGWLTVFERVEFNKGILLYKALHNMYPEYITNMFKFQSSSYGLRSSSNQQLSIPFTMNVYILLYIVTFVMLALIICLLYIHTILSCKIYALR